MFPALPGTWPQPSFLSFLRGQPPELIPWGCSRDSPLITEILPQPKSLWVCFWFSLALSFCLPIPPEAHCDHPTSNTITVQRVLMLSDSSMENKAGFLGKSGDSLCGILLEKGAGVMGGEGTAAGHSTITGNDPESKGRSCRSRSCGGRGAERTGSCRAGWLTLQCLHCLGS